MWDERHLIGGACYRFSDNTVFKILALLDTLVKLQILPEDHDVLWVFQVSRSIVDVG